MVNLRKRKWFLNCPYSPHQNLISNHLECLNRLIDEHSNSFDNFIFGGDFNVFANHNSMINFYDLNGLRNLINVPTCYKNVDNPASIDLILTNRPNYFQHSTAFKTGLSGFHLLTITDFLKRVLKNESLNLSNTVITKTLTTVTSDLKYSSATLATLI